MLLKLEGFGQVKAARLRDCRMSASHLRIPPQQSLAAERRPLQEIVFNQKLKELEYQQLQLQKEVQNSKERVETGYQALLGRFDALEHHLRQQPRRKTRLPHTLTVS